MLTVGRPCKLFAGALFKGPAWQELLWCDRRSSKAGQDTTHSSCFECLQLRSRKQSEMEPWVSTQSWVLQKAGRKLEPKPRGPCEQLALMFRFAMHDVLEIACQSDDSRPRFGSACFFRRNSCCWGYDRSLFWCLFDDFLMIFDTFWSLKVFVPKVHGWDRFVSHCPNQLGWDTRPKNLLFQVGSWNSDTIYKKTWW